MAIQCSESTTTGSSGSRMPPISTDAPPSSTRSLRNGAKSIYVGSCPMQTYASRLRSAHIVVGFSAAFFAITGWIASRKPFWTDELHVVNLASLPTIFQMWDSLLARPDAMPPLVHLLTYSVRRTVGLNHLTARLPAMAGYW